MTPDETVNPEYPKEKHTMDELTPTKIEQLNKMPIIEATVSKSEDGKWVIQKTTITSIKPIKYYQKMLDVTA
ncbi:hypothetical protein J4419_01975 [Candidatus Woesearchaeota archaeon]|nr:hypothetical protein [Candidatus Woesearchaeota archaeon]